jgi:triosephosphate isomerase
LLIFIYSYTLDKNMNLYTFLLGIQDLKDKYSGAYLNNILLELLKKFNIEYNIIR